VLPDDVLDHRWQVPEPHWWVSSYDDIVVPVLPGKHLDAEAGSVIHVNVLPQLVPSPLCADPTIAKRLPQITVHAVPPVRPPTVQRTVAQDCVVEPVTAAVLFDVQFARLFAAAIEATGFAVYVDRARKYVALDTSSPSSFKQDRVPQDIQLDSIERTTLRLVQIG